MTSGSAKLREYHTKCNRSKPSRHLLTEQYALKNKYDLEWILKINQFVNMSIKQVKSYVEADEIVQL